MHRGKVKFALLLVAVSLLVFLILVQQALSRAHVTSFHRRHREPVRPPCSCTRPTPCAPPRAASSPLPMEELSPPPRRSPRPDGIGILSVTFPHLGAGGGRGTQRRRLGLQEEALGAPADLSAGAYPAAAGEAVGTAVDFELGETLAFEGPGGDTVTFERRRARGGLPARRPAHPLRRLRGLSRTPPSPRTPRRWPSSELLGGGAGDDGDGPDETSGPPRWTSTRSPGRTPPRSSRAPARWSSPSSSSSGSTASWCPS